MSIRDHDDKVKFRKGTGIFIEAFLKLLSFHLQSTILGWNNQLYVQKSAVCIRSCVAPAPKNIFLARADQALKKSISGMHKQTFGTRAIGRHETAKQSNSGAKPGC